MILNRMSDRFLNPKRRMSYFFCVLVLRLE